MRESEKLIKALLVFYKKLIGGVRPSDMLILRISKEYGLEEEILLKNINKINRILVSENITDQWRLEEKITEIIDPKRLKKERYELAISKLKELAPDITFFQIEKIGSSLNLDLEQKKNLREEGEELRRGVYRRNSKKKKERPQKAKNQLRRLFLTNPSKLTKEKIREIADKNNVSPIILTEFYRKNYDQWIEIRNNTATIEDLPE